LVGGGELLRNTRVKTEKSLCTCASCSGFSLSLSPVSQKDVHGSVLSLLNIPENNINVGEEEGGESLCFFEWRRRRRKKGGETLGLVAS